MMATLVLSEVVLERDGRVVAAYEVRRDVRGDVVLLDHEMQRDGRPGAWDATLARMAVPARGGTCRPPVRDSGATATRCGRPTPSTGTPE
ncbi:hypothetical protein FHR38_004545 [Micromonospora polyrhachis]|uniref:Uncharacterized protein n=1 Tax=Micromonospora polyrhachis TaxID=1282883 RepID=A0A7W7WRQ3_9ACTN|nr:hypothetical protein [Micromonospora polyrhachis]